MRMQPLFELVDYDDYLVALNTSQGGKCVSES